MSELSDALGTPISFAIGNDVYRLQRFCPAIEDAHAEWLQVRILKDLQKRRKMMSDDDYIAAFVKVSEHAASGHYSITGDAFQESMASVAGTKHMFYQCLKVHHPKITEAEAYQLWADHKTECSTALGGIWGKGGPAGKRANSQESSEPSSTSHSTSTSTEPNG